MYQQIFRNWSGYYGMHIDANELDDARSNREEGLLSDGKKGRQETYKCYSHHVVSSIAYQQVSSVCTCL